MTNDYERYNFWHSELDEFLKKEKDKKVVKYNHEIDKAVKDVRDGKSISNDDVMKEMDKW